MRSVSLKDDLLLLFGDTSRSDRRPENHDGASGKKETRTGVLPVQFARSNRKGIPPLALPAKIGYDDGPVGSLSESKAAAFFNGEEPASVIPLKDIVRAGFFFHLHACETFHLCLKREWEDFIGYTGAAADYRQTSSAAFAPPVEKIHDQIRRIVDGLEKNALGSPTPAAKKEFNRISLLGYMAYGEKEYNELAKELALNSLQCASTHSSEMSDFIKSKDIEKNFLKRVSHHERHLFLMFKSTWIDLELEFAGRRKEETEEKINDEKVVGKCLDVFGIDYVELKTAEYRFARSERRLAAILEDPSLTEEQIAERFAGEDDADRARVERLAGYAGKYESIKKSVAPDGSSSCESERNVPRVRADKRQQYKIHGRTVAEQTKWLQSRIETLEREITKVKASITALRLDARGHEAFQNEFRDSSDIGEAIQRRLTKIGAEIERVEGEYAHAFRRGPKK